MNPHQRGPISVTAERGETNWPAIPTPTKGNPMDPITILPHGQTPSGTTSQTQSSQTESALQRLADLLTTLPYARPIQRLVGLSGGFGA